MTDNGKKFLITTPDDDDVLFYCSEWSKEIIDLAEEKNFAVTELPKAKANRHTVEGYLGKQNPDFVMFNGHGDPDSIYGYSKELLMQKGDNEDKAAGSVIYARSCFALSGLGRACVESGGAKGFVGYKLPFTFVSDPNSSAHPLKDEFAKPSFSTSNIIPMSILKGLSISEAVEKAKVEIDKLIGYWETRSDVVEAPFIASSLHWNKQGLGYHGKADTRL